MTPRRVLVALLAVLSLLVVLVVGILIGRSRLAERATSPILVAFPTRPSVQPTPTPTRDAALARLQDTAANQALEQLRQVAQGKDPYKLPGYLGTSLTIAACPYGCNRVPRLVGFDPNTAPIWTPIRGPLIATGNPGSITLRARLSGTKSVDQGSGAPVVQPLTGLIAVEVSREYGSGWQPVAFSVDPPLVPERDPGAVSTPLPRSTDSGSRLDMPVTTPRPADTQEHERLANEVLQSISTLAAGSPLPYQFSPEVAEQLQQIVSRLAVPGQRVTGLSLEPVQWERVEVRDEDTLELVSPDDTAAMVGYLSGTVWLQDSQGNRKPSPLDPTSEHLVVNLHRRAGSWVVTNVSDGKVDTHSPEEVNTP